MNLRKSMANLALKQMPETVRDEVIRQGTFADTHGLVFASTITMDGRFSFEDRQLFKAIRASLSSAEPQELNVLEGRGQGDPALTIDLQDGVPGLETDGQRFALPDLAILSSSQPIRNVAIRRVLDQGGIIGRQREYWENRSTQGAALTDEEARDLLALIKRGPLSIYRQIRDRVNEGEVALEDLLPKDPHYWIGLVGGLSNGRPLSTFVREAFLETGRHWQPLGHRQALLTMLRWAVAPDAGFEAFAEQIKDSTEVDRLLAEGATTLTDPFSRIGLLALCRALPDGSREERCQAALSLALSEDLEARCRLLSAFFILSYPHVAAHIGFQAEPPWWRRLVVFLHASELVRLLWDCVDLGALEGVVQQKMSLNYVAAAGWDLQIDPVWRGAWASAMQIEAEVLGRLINVCGSDEHLVDIIRNGLDTRADRMPLFTVNYPGPVEIVRRGPSALRGHKPSVEEVTSAAEQPLGSLEIALAVNSLPRIGPIEQVISALCQSIGASRWPTNDTEAQTNFILAACELAFAAAEARNAELAGSILDRLSEASADEYSERFATAIVAAALACTAASTDSSERSRLLRERFPRVIGRRRGGRIHQLGSALVRHLVHLGVRPSDARVMSATLAN